MGNAESTTGDEQSLDIRDIVRDTPPPDLQVVPLRSSSPVRHQKRMRDTMTMQEQLVTAIANVTVIHHIRQGALESLKPRDSGFVREHNRSALHYACMFPPYVDTARMLIDAEADVNVQDELGITPAMLACRGGAVRTLELLIKAKADLEIKDALIQ